MHSRYYRWLFLLLACYAGELHAQPVETIAVYEDHWKNEPHIHPLVFDVSPKPQFYSTLDSLGALIGAPQPSMTREWKRVVEDWVAYVSGECEARSGTIQLKLLIGRHGKPLRAYLERSSGHMSWDSAALHIVTDLVVAPILQYNTAVRRWMTMELSFDHRNYFAGHPDRFYPADAYTRTPELKTAPQLMVPRIIDPDDDPLPEPPWQFSVQLSVDRCGRPMQVRLLQPVHPALDPVMERSLEQAHFLPARAEGRNARWRGTKTFTWSP